MAFGEQGEGFNNPIVGGQGALVRQRIKSPNYNPGVAGWTINRDGSVEFNNGVFRGTVSASVFQGTNFVINTNGAFFYNGAPALGNLVTSIAAIAGTDGFGNNYPAGLSSTKGVFSGSLSAASISAGSIGSAAITGSDFANGTIETTTLTFDSSGGLLLVYATTTVVNTFTSGSGNFTVPAGITALKVECWGGAGGAAGGGLAGGANSGGLGGGAGAYARLNAMVVTPAQIIPYSVGAGGAGGAANNLGHNGNSTTFNTSSCVADGGDAATLSSVGIGGFASASTGDVTFSGGNGGNATGSGGSGGGSSAGTSSAGHNGSNNSGSGSASGGSAVAGGGAGGNGSAANTIGINGSSPGGGGGGGGGGASAGSGGTGSNGKVAITYTSASTLVASISGVSGTDSLGNSYPSNMMGRIVGVKPLSSPQTFEVWTTPTLGTGWTNATSAPVKFRIDAEDNLIITGGIKTTSTTPAATIFTLPSGWRPIVDRIAVVVTNSGGTPGVNFIHVFASTGVVSLGTNLTTSGTELWFQLCLPLGNIS